MKAVLYNVVPNAWHGDSSGPTTLSLKDQRVEGVAELMILFQPNHGIT